MPGPEYSPHFPDDESDEIFGELAESDSGEPEQADAALIDPTVADEAMYRQLSDEEIRVCIVMAVASSQSIDVLALDALGFSEQTIESLVSKGVIEFITTTFSLRAWRTLHADSYRALQEKLKSTSQNKISPAEKSLYSSWAQNDRQLRLQEERGGGEYHFTSPTFAALVLKNNPSSNPQKRRKSS